MSLINEALKKARDKGSGNAPPPSSLPTHFPTTARRDTPDWLRFVIIGVVATALLFGIGVWAGIAFRSHKTSQAPNATAVAQPTPQSAAVIPQSASSHPSTAVSIPTTPSAAAPRASVGATVPAPSVTSPPAVPATTVAHASEPKRVV